MSSLNSLYIKVEKLKEILHVLEIKNAKGLELTISINEDVNEYDQNISAYVSQTKEQRDAKAKRFYVGNGKTFWTDGKITVPEKKKNDAQSEPAFTPNPPPAYAEPDPGDAETPGQEPLPF